MFELLLFAADKALLSVARAGGVSRVIVDLETQGKHRRQGGFDTSISADVPADIAAAHEATSLPVLCRVNPVCAWTRDELDQVIALGAHEVLVPMVRTVAELEQVFDAVAGRCGVAAMIETEAAVAIAADLAAMPLTRVYVGLNDLHIDRGSRHIFTALADGTVERVRRAVGDVPFGFAGLTLPDRGYPLPCRHLVNEMARLDCHFTFLRRSFIRDVTSEGAMDALGRILRAVRAARLRTPDEVERDHAGAVAAIDALPSGPWQLNSVPNARW